MGLFVVRTFHFFEERSKEFYRGLRGLHGWEGKIPIPPSGKANRASTSPTLPYGRVEKRKEEHSPKRFF